MLIKYARANIHTNEISINIYANKIDINIHANKIGANIHANKIGANIHAITFITKAEEKKKMCILFF
jgi:hypothetical protein